MTGKTISDKEDHKVQHGRRDGHTGGKPTDVSDEELTNAADISLCSKARPRKVRGKGQEVLSQSTCILVRHQQTRHIGLAWLGLHASSHLYVSKKTHCSTVFAGTTPRKGKPQWGRWVLTDAANNHDGCSDGQGQVAEPEGPVSHLGLLHLEPKDAGHDVCCRLQQSKARD
jgi:hypothetical protein